MDAGYDYQAIYEQIYRIGSQSIIAYNKKNESELEGFDKYFAPTCVREHSHRYDSYDSTYKTIKYMRPKECKDCPLAEDTLCQKVYKIRITTDLRRYTASPRGAQARKMIYKQRKCCRAHDCLPQRVFPVKQCSVSNRKTSKGSL